MSLVAMLIVIAILGFAVYLLGLVPLDETFRKILRAVAIFVLVIVVVVWLLGALGLGTGVNLNVR